MAKTAKQKPVKKRLNRIKEVLDEKGISQQWLANEARITYASINMYYNGKREPSLEVLSRIAETLKMPLRQLVTDSN